jgi:hypothetical protein
MLLGGALMIMVAIFVTWEDRYVVAFWSTQERYWNALAFAQLGGYVALTGILTAPIKRSLSSDIWRAGVIVASLVVAVRSGSRGQFALTVLLPMIFLPINRPIKNVGQYFTGLGAGALLLAGSFVVFERFAGDEQRWSEGQALNDLNLRLEAASRVLSVWWSEAGQSPLTFIVGLGNSASFAPDIVGIYPHMVPIEILAEEGLLGFTIFLVLIAATVRIFRQAIRLTRSEPTFRSPIACCAAIFTFDLLLSFKQGSFVGFSAEIFLFALLAEQQTRILRAGGRRQTSSARMIVPASTLTSPKAAADRD